MALTPRPGEDVPLPFGTQSPVLPKTPRPGNEPLQVETFRPGETFTRLDVKELSPDFLASDPREREDARPLVDRAEEWVKKALESCPEETREAVQRHLVTVPHFSRALDYLFSDRSHHVYGIARLGEDGSRKGMKLNRTAREMLGNDIASGSGGLAAWLRTICAPEDAEAFISHLEMSVERAAEYGEGMREVYLKLKPRAETATNHMEEFRANVVKNVDAVIGSLDRALALVGLKEVDKDPVLVRPDTATSFRATHARVTQTLRDLPQKSLPALKLTGPKDEYLVLTVMRIPEGVSFAGCQLSPEEAVEARAAERRFRPQPFKANEQHSSYIRQMNAYLGSLEKNHGIPADGTQALQALMAHVAWPTISLIEEHPCPINLHARLSPGKTPEEGWLPICFSRPYAKIIGLTLRDAAKDGGAYLGRIFDPANLESAKGKLSQLCRGFLASVGHAYDAEFTYLSSNKTVAFHTAMVDPGPNTVQVREGKDVSAMAERRIAVPAAASKYARRSLAPLMPATD